MRLECLLCGGQGQRVHRRTPLVRSGVQVCHSTSRSSASLMSDDEPPAPLPHMESSEEELQLDRRNVATTELDVPGEAESSSTLGGPSFGRGGSAASVGSLGSQASDASGQMRI